MVSRRHAFVTCARATDTHRATDFDSGDEVVDGRQPSDSQYPKTARLHDRCDTLEYVRSAAAARSARVSLIFHDAVAQVERETTGILPCLDGPPARAVTRHA